MHFLSAPERGLLLLLDGMRLQSLVSDAKRIPLALSMRRVMVDDLFERHHLRGFQKATCAQFVCYSVVPIGPKTPSQRVKWYHLRAGAQNPDVVFRFAFAC